jgi:hypothetical protein
MTPQTNGEKRIFHSKGNKQNGGSLTPLPNQLNKHKVQDLNTKTKQL